MTRPHAYFERELVDGNSKLEISRSASQMAGPGLGGILVQALTAPYAVLVDALSFLGSGLFLLGIRKHEEAPQRADGAPHPSMLREAREGLGYVLGNRYLRSIAACTAISNFATNVAFAIFLVYAVRSLDLSPAVIGIVFSISSVGALAGALTATRVSSRLGVGPTIVCSAFVFGPALFLVPAAPSSSPIPFLVTAFVLFGFTGVIYNITQLSFRQAICPERMQGRMNAVMRFIVWGVIPLGSLLGGALATWIGLRETMWIGAIIGSLAFVPVLFSPVRTLREMPTPVSTEPAPDLARAARSRGMGAGARPARVALVDRASRPGAHRDPQDRRSATFGTGRPPLLREQATREEPPLPHGGR